MKRIFTLGLLLSLISTSSFANTLNKIFNFNKSHKTTFKLPKSGGMDGGGTGSIARPELGSAWYYQDKKEGYITVCTKKSSKFKATQVEIEKAISESFIAWDKYILKSKLYDETDDNDNEVQAPTYSKILTKIKFEKCSKDTNLTFYFGVKDSIITNALNGRSHLKGFAFRELDKIDAKKAYSKGYVWIFDPSDTVETDDDFPYQWDKPGILRAVLTHEIGHVMGVGHVENTIMREDLKTILTFSQVPTNSGQDQYTRDEIKKSKKFVKEIDHENSIIKIFDFQTGSFKGKMGLAGTKELNETFNFFMKRDPVGEVIVELLPGVLFDHILKYKISDDHSSKIFIVNKFSQDMFSLDKSSLSTNIFKRYRIIKDSDGWFSHEHYNNWRFRGNFNVRFVFKNRPELYVIMGINQSEIQYETANNPSGINNVFSRSDLSLHYIDSNFKTRIMYVDQIGKYDTSKNK